MPRLTKILGMSQNAIELRGITRTFGSNQALRGVDLVLPGGPVGLLGPNGAGKSTLLKIILGLLNPTSGEGSVFGYPISPNSTAPAQLRSLVGYMPEADALVPSLRGIDYVSLAGELCGLTRKQSLRRSHEVLEYLELGEARYRNVEEYSTGMKQRVKLAQALVHDPPLLLLDEPTSGLDPAGREAMLRLLKQLGQDFGKTMLISTHLLADVETVCERVVILYGGQIAGVGTVAELCPPRPGRYRVRVIGDTNSFSSQLQAHKIEILNRSPQGEWVIRGAADLTVNQLIEYAHRSSCTLRAAIPDDETLEETYRRLVASR